MNDQGFERRLAAYGVKKEHLERSGEINLARNAFVDIVACMMAGSANREVKHLVEAVTNWASGGISCVIGHQHRYHPPWAALVNGASAHALDFDDNFLPAFTHASSVLFPAILSLAESENLPGLDLLDAYIFGLELHDHIGKMVNPEQFQKGWHTTSTVGTIGTAGACARLLGLGEDAVLNAMSIGFSMASGSKRQFGSMMKPIHAGLAAQHAVMAAKMAANQITGNHDFLSGDWGFQGLYGETNPAKADTAISNLEVPFLQQNHSLLVKRFPCCASAHKTLDGLLELKEEHHLNADDIKRVTARLPQTLRRNLPFARPENEMEARFSLPYAAARILIEGRLSLLHFTKKAVDQFKENDLMDRIKIETIPDPEELNLFFPIYSRVELMDGKILEIEIRDLKGSSTNPLSTADMKSKFIDCLQFAGRIEHADDLFSAVMSIAKIDRIEDLTDQLSGHK